MECGPVRYRVDAKKMDSFSVFRHVVRVRSTPFVPKTGALDKEGTAKFADIVAELASDAAHYRRDRRKDFLLQKNGYLVLRFLSEDVTHRLSQVVCEISAAFEARGRISAS